MKKQFTIILIHLSIWSLFLLVPLLLLPQLSDATKQEKVFYLLPFFSVGIFISAFYINYLLLLPRFLRSRKRWTYIVMSVVTMVVLVAVQVAVRDWLIRHFDVSFEAPPVPIAQPLGFFFPTILHILVWGTSSGLWLLREWQQSSELLRESENKRRQAELQQLRKQINPHFLFNTLNSIYTLVQMRQPEAGDAVLQLSDLMSYVLTDAEAEEVDLQLDLEHLMHFVALNKLRFADDNLIQFTPLAATHAHRIAPLLLLPFVENAFKYGHSNITPAPIIIRLDLKGNVLTFYCENRINSEAVRTQQGTSTGLANVKNRLQLLYPQRHQLKIENDGLYFVVHLQIELRIH